MGFSAVLNFMLLFLLLANLASGVLDVCMCVMSRAAGFPLCTCALSCFQPSGRGWTTVSQRFPSCYGQKREREREREQAREADWVTLFFRAYGDVSFVITAGDGLALALLHSVVEVLKLFLLSFVLRWDICVPSCPCRES